MSSRRHLPVPGPDAAAVSARLVGELSEEIRTAGGWMPFDRYMERVLYTPGLGYYAAGARKIGDSASGGDFVTAPEISPLFAQSLAVQIAQLCSETAPCIVEFGAGSGVLARDLIDALGAHNLDVDYAIVELSAELAERQQALLAERRVRWLAAPPPDFDGVIIANEVLDVMPVRLFAKRAGQVFERGVVLRNGQFAFDERPADAAMASAVREIEAEVGTLPDGYQSELGMVAAAWTASAARWLRRGAVVLIDYGFPRREYYHPQRLMGTLMCHYRHHAHDDPFYLPGLNDLTAHVDFSAVAAAAHHEGLDVLGFTSQASFLINCGLLDLLQQSHNARNANRAHRLISEAEMGELFKVLVLGRGLDSPLLGFARGDRTARL